MWGSRGAVRGVVLGGSMGGSMGVVLGGGAHLLLQDVVQFTQFLVEHLSNIFWQVCEEIYTEQCCNLIIPSSEMFRMMDELYTQ